jgi:hypothetical protein
MKKSILLLITFVAINLNTIAQESKSNCNYSDSIFILKTREKYFDIIKYKKELEKGGEVIITENDKYKSSFSVLGNYIDFVQINKDLGIDKTINYTSDGKINYMVNYLSQGSSLKIGIKNIFNPDGTIKKTTNYDKGYTVCWNEIIPIFNKTVGKNFLKKYEIEITGITRTNLNDNPTLQPKWYVSIHGNEAYYKKIKKANGITYIFDGITGKLLNKRPFNVVD